jgi:hypothetical protein
VRRQANPATPPDPDLLPGTADVAAPDPSAASGGEAGAGYLWDAALRAGLSVRNYGFYGDVGLYDAKRYNAQNGLIPLSRDPFTDKLQVFFPTKASLAPHTDVYFRGFDMAFPDFWRVREWQREFAEQVADRRMPSLTLLRLPQSDQQVAVVVLGARSNAGRFMETQNLFTWLSTKAATLFATRTPALPAQ